MGRFRVCAVRGQNLPNADSWPKNPAPDTFVRISLVVGSSVRADRLFTPPESEPLTNALCARPACDWQIVSGPVGTRFNAIDNNNNPRWNFCRELTTDRSNADLRLEIIDYDIFGEDELGPVFA